MSVLPRICYPITMDAELQNLSSSQISTALGRKVESSKFLNMPNEKKAKYQVNAEFGAGQYRLVSVYVWVDNSGSLRAAM